MKFERAVIKHRDTIDTLDRNIVFSLGLMRVAQVRWNQPEVAVCAKNLMHAAMWARFATTDAVGELKIRHNIESTIQAGRRDQVFSNAQSHQAEFEDKYNFIYAPDEVNAGYHAMHEASVERQEKQKAVHASRAQSAA